MYENLKKGSDLIRRGERTKYIVDNVFPDNFDATNQDTKQLETFCTCDLYDYFEKSIESAIHDLDKLEDKLNRDDS